MPRIHEKLPPSTPATRSLTLPHDKRQKSRARVALDDGAEAELWLERGSSLQHGDRLLADDGSVVAVCAAPERVSIVSAADPKQLARAAYHLGNRHVALQVEAGRLVYLHDHVLDDLVRALGLTTSFAIAPFEPEAGAYGHGHARHSHGQDHDHDHGHDHGHNGHAHDHHDHGHGTGQP
jgi:urease accessory protein